MQGRSRRVRKSQQTAFDNILTHNERKKCDAVFDAISGNKTYIGKDNIMQLLKGIRPALMGRYGEEPV